MKNSLILLLILITGCTSMNRVVYDSEREQNILIDECNRAAFNSDQFEEWFYKEYNKYEPDSETLQKIKGELYNFDITMVMATWCPDCIRDIPRMFKILDHLAYHEPKIRLIGVDGKKKSAVKDFDNLNITSVPTFIIYKNKTEVGRIVENAKESLEKDLVEIILKNLD